MNVYVDVGDIYHKLHRHFDEKLDYDKYLEYLEKMYGTLNKITAYVPQRDREASGFITCLKSIGFDVKYKRPRIFVIGDREIKRCNWGVEITVDIMNDKSQTVVLGVSDTDYIPLVQYLKTLGIRVIIFASYVPTIFNKIADEVIEITKEMFEDEGEEQ